MALEFYLSHLAWIIVRMLVQASLIALGLNLPTPI